MNGHLKKTVMKKNTLNNNLFSIIIFSLSLIITSCGSFEGVSYYATDGIYNDDNSISYQKNNLDSEKSNDQSAAYYENYFKNFSNNSSNQVDDGSSTNDNNNVYIIDNSPNLRFGFGGFNNFNYWNNWAFNDFWYPYNTLSFNRFGLFFNPFWDWGYQGMYFNNAWGYGYSLYGWNNYNPYNYIVSNRGRNGRKIAYNRGSSIRNSTNSINRGSFRNSKSLLNSMPRSFRGQSNNNIRSNMDYNRINNSNNNYRPVNRSSSSGRSYSGSRSSGRGGSSVGSRPSRSGRQN